MSEYLVGFPLIFGLIASVIHVVAGPDHLAAIGPLAISTRYRAWLIGMSWGGGHIIGMLLLGTIFFFFRDLIPIDFISNNSEKLVGILLLAIGIWALLKIKGLLKLGQHHDHKHQVGQDTVYVHRHNYNFEKDKKYNEAIIHTHDIKIEKQSYKAAAGIGLIHGFAGVSHIVSMLPTLAFENNKQAIMYLVGFAFGTIISMVIFSFLLGLLSKYASRKRKDTILIVMNSIAGLAAIIIGILWIWKTW